MRILRLLFIAAVLLALPSIAVAQIDCDVYANFAGAEPDGYAEQCLGSTLPTRVTRAPLAPGDTSFKYDMRDNPGWYTHPLSDFSAQTFLGNPNALIFATDWSADGSTLWAIDFNTNEWGTVSPADGSFTSLGAVTGAGTVDTITGMTIDGSGNAYIIDSAATGAGSTLYSFDLGTGVATAIGNTGLAIAIDIAINCEGRMVAHDISTDSFYDVNLSDASTTLIGAHGLAANFAQGLDFDMQDGILYAYIYTGGGTNTYATVDLTNGSLTPINVDNPLGEWEGAIPNTCFQNPLEIPTVNVVGLVVLALLLALGAALMLRRRTA